MPKEISNILICALLSSGIFLAVLFSGLDFIFMFLATLPLFAGGFSNDHRTALKAAIVAVLPILLLTNSPSATILFFLVFALPSWYVCYATLRYYDIKLVPPLPSLRLWYPVGLVTLDLAIYGNILLAITTAFFATQEMNLPQQISQMIQQEITLLSKDYAINFDIVTKDISFMLCGFLVWLWCTILLANAWIANGMLAKKNLAKRPNLIITPFPMPYWLLSLMAIWALASLIGGESMRFLGKSSLIILLLPYFFQGAALLHANSKNWANRQFLLFFIYLSIALFLWPALIIAGAGVWLHIKTFNKHLSSGGSSSKN